MASHGVFIISQANNFEMPQVTIRRPFRELDLREPVRFSEINYGPPITGASNLINGQKDLIFRVSNGTYRAPG